MGWLPARSGGQDVLLTLPSLMVRTSWWGSGPRAPYLVHLVHVVLRVSSRPLGRDGVSC